MSVGPLGDYPPELSKPTEQLHPQQVYEELHANGSLRWDQNRGCWDIYGYELVKEVANDHDRFSVRFDADPEFVEPEGGMITGKSMLYQDPPRHDELRSVVDDFFKPGAVRSLTPEIETTADRLLTEATAAGGEFDLVTALSYPLPVLVIAEMIGVPADDRELFREWSTFAVSASGNKGPEDEMMQQFRDGITAYFDDLVAKRRENPKDDLLSKVIATEGLDREEMLGFFIILLIAGNITTTNLITNAVWTLAEEDSFDTLRENPEMIDVALEEVLRYRSPVQTHTRVAVKDTELDGKSISAGDRIGVWFGAANHDPTVFDRPDEFIIDRQPNPHVAFGHGTHFCLGAHLARLEAKVAIKTLLDRFETITLVEKPTKPSGSMLVYGPQSLRVSVS